MFFSPLLKRPERSFGCWKLDKATCSETVYNAIKEGYRLFDGASDYGNEKEAGEGIALAIKDGLIKREDVCEYHHVFGV